LDWGREFLSVVSTMIQIVRSRLGGLCLLIYSIMANPI